MIPARPVFPTKQTDHATPPKRPKRANAAEACSGDEGCHVRLRTHPRGNRPGHRPILGGKTTPGIIRAEAGRGSAYRHCEAGLIRRRHWLIERTVPRFASAATFTPSLPALWSRLSPVAGDRGGGGTVHNRVIHDSNTPAVPINLARLEAGRFSATVLCIRSADATLTAKGTRKDEPRFRELTVIEQSVSFSSAAARSDPLARIRASMRDLLFLAA